MIQKLDSHDETVIRTYMDKCFAHDWKSERAAYDLYKNKLEAFKSEHADKYDAWDAWRQENEYEDYAESPPNVLSHYIFLDRNEPVEPFLTVFSILVSLNSKVEKTEFGNLRSHEIVEGSRNWDRDEVMITSCCLGEFDIFGEKINVTLPHDDIFHKLCSASVYVASGSPVVYKPNSEKQDDLIIAVRRQMFTQEFKELFFL